MSLAGVLLSRIIKVHVPHNEVLRVLVPVILVQVLGRYMIVGHLDGGFK